MEESNKIIGVSNLNSFLFQCSRYNIVLKVLTSKIIRCLEITLPQKIFCYYILVLTTCAILEIII